MESFLVRASLLLPYAVDATRHAPPLPRTNNSRIIYRKEAAPQLYVHAQAAMAGGGGREEYRQTVALVATLGMMMVTVASGCH